MMATASPTPLGSSHFSILNRRPPSRQALRQAPARPTLNHNGSFSAYNSSTAAAEAAAEAGANARHFTSNDSSDDELPMPMKFSALTKALLDGEASILEPTSPINTNQNHNLSGSTAVEARHARSNTPSLPESQRRERDTSPGFASSRGSNRAHSPFPRRVVRLSGSPRSSTLKRTSNLALAKQRHAEQEAAKEPPLDLATPAPVPRTVRIPITSSGNHGSSFGSSGRSGTRYGSGSRATSEEYDGGEEPATIGRAHLGVSLGSVSRYGGATLNRTRFGDDTGMQSSMRVKRLGKVAGSFLSGPARRGRRRQSEEDQERETEAVDGLDAFGSQEPQSQEPGSSQEPESQEPESQPFESQEQISSQVPESNPGSFYSSTHRDFASGSPLGSKENIRHVRVPTPPQSLRHASLLVQENNKPQPSISAQPSFRIPPPRPDLPSTHDQENEAPPTFKRHKPASLVHLDKVEKVALRPQSADFSVLRANPSPERRPLAARSQNTPRRPAPPPPPPKMSLLETATATAGAATTSHANKKRNNIRVNGKSFTRMEIVGRGGSSKVWRVMAENGKVYALKRVSLEDADENAVRGYKGEIDLLKKMEGNDRVVRLLDYEMNDEKQMLSVLMEMGEIDFNKILTLRFNTESARFDPSFTRHYWKEMLECILAVHASNIVHSDLKPANFVLVQGRLKLIDFGIANAIQTDETVNVHRDTQIGTPNYMSPESLMDANDLPGNKALGSSSHGQPKIMKLGKPSDIWSLGCILYQMTYGRQPFAHIANQMSRCRAIIDWSYAIEFPSHGIGNILVPPSLVATLKKCLNRNQHERPNAEELLSESNPWLYPVECPQGAVPITEELLARVFHSMMQKAKEKWPSDGEVMVSWPQAYMAGLRKMARDGS